MKRDFKRVVSAALATVMVAQAGGVSALAAPLTTQSTTTTSATPTAAGMHQFTGTPALIQSAIEDLKAQGVTYQKDEPDKALVKRVETASDKSYATVKTDLAQALVDQREDGTVDVSDLGLTQKDMAAVLQETLYDKYMNHAVTDVTYQTEGGKVTGINYNMSEGFAAAMDAIDDEQQEAAVDTDAVASEVAEQTAAEESPAVYSAVATYAAEDEGRAVSDDDTVSSGAESGTTDDSKKDETGNSGTADSKCKYHTVGEIVTLKGDLNGDGKINGSDATILNDMVLEKRDTDTSADLNGDGKINGSDATILNDIILEKRDPEKTVTGSDINFEWAEVAGESGNTGLYYDVKNHRITQGDLPDYHYELSKVSFTCSECGQTIEITDKDALSQMVSRYDVYLNTKTYNTVTVNHGSKPTASDIKDGESLDDYIQYTDMAVASYTDDTFKMADDTHPVTDADGNVIGLYTGKADNGELQVKNYYAQLSAFNADNAEYMGVSTDFWTSKNSDSNPMAAVKVLCNQDADAQIPPSQMLQMVQGLPQAFMAYVHYYGPELLAMRDKAMAVVDALPSGTTEVQKQLVLHDWLADNCTFDMGVMTTVNSAGGNPQTDPIQMTTFGSLLSDQLTEMPTYTDDKGNDKSYHGAICLGYTAAYTYLIQNMHPEVYKAHDESGNIIKDEDGNDVWNTPEQVGDNDLVDFIQAKFYADTAETSVAGDGFGGGAFNNVHYMNAIRLKDAPNASSDGEWFYTDVCYDDIYIECMAQYRGEAQGSIYHTYFLMSPQSIAALYEKGNSIDYIDSLYDGYVYEIAYQKNTDGSIKTDDKGNKLVEPSENIDKSKKYYDETHPKYNKVDAPEGTETKSDNTCYEDSWFSGAVSRIYTDGTNWYYVDGGKTMASQRQSVENSKDDSPMKDMMDKVDKEAYTHSNRVNVENSDKLKYRSISAKDYWEDNSNSNNPMGNSFSKKEDPYAKTLFDYGTGKFTNTETPVLEAEAKQDFAYTEQYPCLTHSIGMYDGKIYFNLANRIYTYDTKAESNPVALFKEYNEVKYSDDGRSFKATAFYADANGSKSVTNKPIASLEIYDDYDFSQSGGAYTPVKDEAGNITGLQFNGNVQNVPTLIVNIATDLSFSYPDTDHGYTEEAINYNPDYQRQVSSDDANKNGEFLWCANIRDTAKVTDLLSDLESSKGTDTKIPANCYTAEHTLKLTDKYSLVKEDKGVTDGAEHKGHSYKYNSTEKMYICETCGQHASVLLNAGKGGTAVMTSVADTGMGELLKQFGEDKGEQMGLSKTADSIDPEREAATKTKDGKITLTVTPDEGYEVDEAYYVEAVADTTDTDDKTENGGDSEAATQADTTEETKVQLTKNDDGTYTITKPEACINVFVTFKQKEAEANAISIENAEHGKVTADVEKAKAGEKVTLTVTADDGYKLADLTENGLQVAYEVPADTETQADDAEKPATKTEYAKVTAGAEANTYTFEMPAYAVKVTAKFVEVKAEKTYDVTVENAEGGKVTADPTKAAADATVTLTVAADEGFELDTLTATYEVPGANATDAPTVETVKDLKAAEDEAGKYTFTMPAYAVKVTPKFKAKEEVKTYSITIPATIEYGKVTADKEVAAAGDEVNLTITPDSGYQLKVGSLKITYFDAENAKQEQVVDGTNFKMPAANVTVSAAFEKVETTNSGAKKDEHGSNKGNNDSGNTDNGNAEAKPEE